MVVLLVRAGVYRQVGPNRAATVRERLLLKPVAFLLNCFLTGAALIERSSTSGSRGIHAATLFAQVVLLTLNREQEIIVRQLHVRVNVFVEVRRVDFA